MPLYGDKYLVYLTQRGILNMRLKNVHISEEELEQFKIILEDWIPKNASIAIAVDQTYIYFSEGEHFLHLEVGNEVGENSIANRVLQTRRKTDAVMDDSLFDSPYYVIGYPIFLKEKPAALVIILPSSFSKPPRETYRFLTGKQDDDWSPVPIEEISHIESLQKKTWFYMNGNQYKANVTLKELQTRLPNIFIRIHRSYIINIHFIKKITRDLASNFVIVLKDGSELPVSQSYLSNLRNILEF